MRPQTLNLKTIFIALLWIIVAICAVTSFYYTSYVQTFGYTDSRMWIDMVFYSVMAFSAFFVVKGFDKKRERKKNYKKRIEILHLFAKVLENNGSISLTEILSKTSFTKIETKGILEHLVEKKILIPNLLEEQELIYKLTSKSELEKYLSKMK